MVNYSKMLLNTSRVICVGVQLSEWESLLWCVELAYDVRLITNRPWINIEVT